MIYLLIALLTLAALVGIPSYIGHRRYTRRVAEGTARPEETSPMEVTKEVPEECCGQHATCERDSLLAAVSKEVQYYDDEELDAYRGRASEDYTDDEAEAFANVFYELREVEVAGWVRSLQLRGINLPEQLMDEVLLVVRERRFRSIDEGDHSNDRVGRGAPLASLLILMAVSAAVLLGGCKANNAVNRSMKGLTTRYNVHFNGREAYREGLKGIEEKHNEEYSQRIQLHPVYGLVGAKEPSKDGHLERAIEKCKIALQQRSITNKPKRKNANTPEKRLWLQRGEYNPYMHNVWLLSGKAQFYEGDFNSAAATFEYTARHFWWKPLAIAECHIWRARIAAVQGFNYEAETELGLVISPKQYSDVASLQRLPAFKELPRSLRNAFCIAQAEILLCRPETSLLAIEWLEAGRNTFMTQAQRLRCDYLRAQLLEEAGRDAEANRLYRRLAGSGRDYRMQFNARIARTRVMPHSSASDLRKMEHRLNRLRHQSRNEEYLDQIYYALGNVALQRGDSTTAIAHYEKALEVSTRNGLDKAAAALRLGEVAYAQADYIRAQRAYSIAMGIIKPDYPNYADIERLSTVLDELQTHAETVHLQDSLLTLSELPRPELDKVIERIIKELIEKEREAEDEERQSEWQERRRGEVDPLAADQPQQPTVGPVDKSWYFYNPAQISAGKTDFQRRWGSRKPEDHWRRKNKTETDLNFNDNADGNLNDNLNDNADNLSELQAVADSTSTAEREAEANEAGGDATDPHQPAYYLAQIPFTEAQKATSNQLVEEGLWNMAGIINERLENFPRAISTYLQLEKRYPETEHRPEMYFTLYLIYMRMADIASRQGQPQNQAAHLAEAEVWRQRLCSTFPETTYGLALANGDYIATLQQMVAQQDSVYEQTYEAYLEGKTEAVHQTFDFVEHHWPLSKLLPKFLFLHALSYVQEGDAKGFQDNLERLTATYPESDVSPLASLMVKRLREGAHLNMGSIQRGMRWGTSLRRDGADDAAPDSTLQFVDDDNAPHLLLLCFRTDTLPGQDLTAPADTSARQHQRAVEAFRNNLLFEVAKFNFENYLVKDFDLEIIDTQANLSVLVISGFSNLKELIDYHDRMDQSESLELPDGLTEVDISDPNFRLLLQGLTFEQYFDWIQKTYNPSPTPNAP